MSSLVVTETPNIIPSEILTITSIFNLMAEGDKDEMDKMSNIGKGGQMPWAPSGIGNDGNNKVIGMIRAMRRMSDAAYVQEYRHGT